MRMKILGAGGNGRFAFVFPSTFDEYREMVGTACPPVPPGHNGAYAPRSEWSGPGKACYLVTTSVQRRSWDLPDFAASGRVPIVDEDGAIRVLDERAARPGDACRPFRDDVTEESPASPRWRGSEGVASDKKKVRLRSKLPWRTSHPQWFDREHVMHVLNRTHGGLETAKARIADLLAASPQSCNLLTVEICRPGGGSNPDPRFALVVRPGSTAPPRVLCLAGPRGAGKTSLTVSIAEALGRAHVRMSLKGELPSFLIFGNDAAPGEIVSNLARVQVKNPVVVLDALDVVGEEGVEPLTALLDSSLRRRFKDEFLGVPFDLSPIFWIATVVDSSAIPEALRSYLEIVELPAYTEEEKLAIAEQYLLARPFDGSVHPPAAVLAPDSAVFPAADGTGPAPSSERPVVLLDRLISGPAELAAFSAEPPPGGRAAEAWRTAASSGAVRFQLDAIRLIIRDYTSEVGVGELNRLLAQVCREMERRRPPGLEGPDIVTPVVVAEILGTAPVDSLPPAVRAAIAVERRRLSDGSSDTSKETNSWIEWLQHLPWTRRNDRRIDLAAVRAALDAAQAGLKHAKASVMEYLAVRRRNPVGAGSVLCFLGPPGVGKTSLAQAIAQALGRGFAKVSCGGLRDETELRGHNRTWRSSQPGAILRELRRVGYRDPVFVFDEIDKMGPDPAAVLLEVFDPEQQSRFRDAFVELPFDLSEALFIATANDLESIPGPLRDRLDIICLPDYTEADKVAIAESHLIPRENRAAGLTSNPPVFESDALQKIIRDYTAEPGVRQLGRHLRSICRKVALGRETGDGSLIRERITVEDVTGWLGDDALAGDGLDPLRRQLDAPDLPEAVRSRSREVFKRLSGLVPGNPEYVRLSEYLRCLAAIPWAGPTVPPIDRLQVRAKLDETHVGLRAAKDRIVDLLAVGAPRKSHAVPAFCLLGPSGVGKTSLARSLAAAFGRAAVCVNCQEISDRGALLGVPEDRSGRIVEELRGAAAGAAPPVFIFDEIDRLTDCGGVPEALLEVLASRTSGGFRDRYVDLPLDLSGALFVATAARLDQVPALFRDHFLLVQLPGYTEKEQLAIADHSLLPEQLRIHSLPGRSVRVTPDALRALVRGYSPDPGLWPLGDALLKLCGTVARRRAEGDESFVEVTPAVVAEMLGPPECSETPLRDRPRRPGVSTGLGVKADGSGLVSFFEVVCMSGDGHFTVTGSVGDVMGESARLAFSWLRANAGRYGLDPGFHRGIDVHLHVQPHRGPRDGVSAGTAMVAALVSAFTGRPVAGDVATTGEITISGDVLPVGAIQEKVMAARRRGLTRVVLPAGTEKQFDGLDDELRREMTVHYVKRIDELLELVLCPDRMPERAGGAKLLSASPQRLF